MQPLGSLLADHPAHANRGDGDSGAEARLAFEAMMLMKKTDAATIAYSGSCCFVPHPAHLTVLPRVSAVRGSGRLQRQHVTSFAVVVSELTAARCVTTVTAGVTGAAAAAPASRRPAIPSDRH